VSQSQDRRQDPRSVHAARRHGLAPCLALAGALVACTGGHRYGVPRTLAPGAVAHHLSLDFGRNVIGTRCTQELASESPAHCTDVIDPDPEPIPAYEVRIGLANRLELGAGVAADTSGQVDLKVQVLRTPGLDVALAPTVGGALILPRRFGADVANARFALLPVLVGVRLGPLTLVPAAAIGSVDVTASADADEPDAARGGMFWMGSFATFFPVSQGVRLGPGLTLLRPPGEHADWQLLGGLTVALGDAPE
jgi:hypothetical protein